MTRSYTMRPWQVRAEAAGVLGRCRMKDVER
jgi:hypothetical protein